MNEQLELSLASTLLTAMNCLTRLDYQQAGELFSHVYAQLDTLKDSDALDFVLHTWDELVNGHIDILEADHACGFFAMAFDAIISELWEDMHHESEAGEAPLGYHEDADIEQY
jgi:hypothetical protein